MIYFVTGRHDPKSLIKIGYVKGSLAKRISDMQTGNPYRIVPLLIVDGEIKDEKELQRSFCGARYRGEWFKPAPELIKFIRETAGEWIEKEIVSASQDEPRIEYLAKTLGWEPEEVRSGLLALQNR